MPSKRLNGPDMTDAKTMIQALEAMHAVSIGLTLEQAPELLDDRWTVTLLATSDSATPMEAPKRYHWSRVCASHGLSELGSIVYNGCYELEKKLQHGQWVQVELL